MKIPVMTPVSVHFYFASRGQYLQQVQEEDAEANKGGIFAGCVIYGVQAAPEACIHGAEHGCTAAVLGVQVAQGGAILHQTPATQKLKLSMVWLLCIVSVVSQEVRPEGSLCSCQWSAWFMLNAVKLSGLGDSRSKAGVH